MAYGFYPIEITFEEISRRRLAPLLYHIHTILFGAYAFLEKRRSLKHISLFFSEKGEVVVTRQGLRLLRPGQDQLALSEKAVATLLGYKCPRPFPAEENGRKVVFTVGDELWLCCGTGWHRMEAKDADPLLKQIGPSDEIWQKVERWKEKWKRHKVLVVKLTPQEVPVTELALAAGQ